MNQTTRLVSLFIPTGADPQDLTLERMPGETQILGLFLSATVDILTVRVQTTEICTECRIPNYLVPLNYVFTGEDPKVPIRVEGSRNGARYLTFLIQ